MYSVQDLRLKYYDRLYTILSYKDCLYCSLPHYQEAEKLIFCEWLRDKSAYGDYIFDLAIPPKAKADISKLPDSVRRQAEYLLALKIDAVRLRDEGVELIEVKRRALASGIGQLITYKSRFEDEFKGVRVLRMIYVVPLASQDIRDAARELGIEVHEVSWLAMLGLRYRIPREGL